jgi:ESS family glutamate:Na+ symporter
MEKWDIIIYFILIGVLLFVGKILKTKFPFLNRIVLPTALLGGMVGLTLSLVYTSIAPGADVVYDYHIIFETDSYAYRSSYDHKGQTYYFEEHGSYEIEDDTLTYQPSTGGTFTSIIDASGSLTMSFKLSEKMQRENIVVVRDAPGGFVGTYIGETARVIPASLINLDLMVAIVYHALALGFISLALKQGETKNKRKIWSTGMVITSTYALQGFIGILLVLIFFSDKFVGAGMLLPLGFGQGPGLAMSFGNMWSSMLGGHGVALGASYAFLGFVWGGTIGVLAINIISRRKGRLKPKNYEESSSETTSIQIDTVKEISILDGLTTQVVIISLIYGMVWLTLFLLEKVLVNLGSIGGTIFGLLEGFNFIIGIAYALIYKKIIRRAQRKGRNLNFIKNDYILSNISSLCFNIMIAGAVLTITVDFLQEFWLLLLVVSLVGGIATLFYVRFITRKVYTSFKDEYFVGLFGMLSGVASTGIALLKGIDRDLESPVAEEMVLGSGTAITMALPLFGFLMLPSLGYQKPYESLFEWIALLGCILYVVIMVIILLVRSKRVPT